ncbi:hypothetical protein GGR54DRAFT_307642 [Hypoxylon sp. NC1633]|nr:hypothetical protein GGR54DRAFT_307642 [Hypoxylon sp. NC1633]
MHLAITAAVAATATLPVIIVAAATHEAILVQPSTSIKLEDPPGLMTSMPVFINTTDSITQARQVPPPTAVGAEKPAWEASIMGLIVFSVAGLCLL